MVANDRVRPRTSTAHRAMLAGGFLLVWIFPARSQDKNATPPASRSVSEPAKAVERTALRTHGQMRVEVVDAADKPLAEAVVRVEVTTTDDLEHNRTYHCDARGRTTVDLPKTISLVSLDASKPGFCAEQEWFQPGKRTGQSFMKDECRFRLVRPITIGGIVKDEEGQMVAGARLQFFQSAAFERGEAFSDAKGRWHLDARPDGGTRLTGITHPDYLANVLWGAVQRNKTSPWRRFARRRPSS